MHDPLSKKKDDLMKILDWKEPVYGVEEDFHPRCIFLPEKHLIHSMIKANILYSLDGRDSFLLRFGTVWDIHKHH